MRYLYLSCRSGVRKVVECPAGVDPDEFAEQHNAGIYQSFPTRAEAEFALASDPNGKMEIW